METKRLRAIALTALIASSVSLSGCQQMGFRDRNDELKQLIAEQDDWALPQSTQGNVPRPTAFELSGRKRNDLIKRPSDSSKDSDLREPQRLVTKQDEPRSNHDDVSDNIISTLDQELDIEKDLATLPPAYRELLKKQLELVQQKGNEGLNESRLATEQKPKAIPQQPNENPVVDEAKTAATEPPKDRGAGKVKVRMSDTMGDDHNAIATKKAPSVTEESMVINAIANSIPASPPSANPISDSAGHSVVQASGVVSIPVNATPITNSQTLSIHSISPPSNLSWRQLLGQTIEQLEKQIKEIPETDENLRINQEVTLRMLYLSQRRLDDASREIASLSDQEQEYFRHQLHALHEASNPDAMPVRSRRWSLVMNSQREATNKLAAISNLEVKSAAFCTKVDGYGSITKFPKYYFEPDQELLLYCEVENVSANKVKDGYESQLQGSYEIIDSQGRKVADQLLPVEAEICQNHRRDYFIVYKIYMPQQIAPGNYQLRLMVEDSKARKFGQSNLDFHIKK